jgi:integrase
MPYKRELRGSIVWMASYYVPNSLLPLSVQSKKASKTRIKEPARDAGYPNTQVAAGQLERRRKAEIAEGTFSYGSTTGEHNAETWLNEWSEARGTRYSKGDKRRVEMHFLTFRDFRGKPLSAFRTEHFKEWGRHGKALVEQQKAMSSKNFWTVYGVVHAMFEAAVDATKIPFNPCNVDGKSDMPRKRDTRGRRYDETETEELAWCEALPPDVRMLLCGLAFTGERVGEFCGHIWSEWDRTAVPLSALTLEFQYDRQPLKGDTDRERPRRIPVHPELESALDWWKREGWEAFVGRAPRPTDPIFPNVFKDGHHSEKSVYHRVKDAFDKATAEGRISSTWKAHHALRHSVTTALIGRGASPVWVERITHNASGKLIDPTTKLTVNHYTHTDWRPLCDTIALLPWRRRVTPSPAGSREEELATRGANGSDLHETTGNHGGVCESPKHGSSRNFLQTSGTDPEFESLLPLYKDSTEQATRETVWPPVWPSGQNAQNPRGAPQKARESSGAERASGSEQRALTSGDSRLSGARSEVPGWWGPSAPPAVAADFGFLHERGQVAGGAL